MDDGLADGQALLQASRQLAGAHFQAVGELNASGRYFHRRGVSATETPRERAA